MWAAVVALSLAIRVTDASATPGMTCLASSTIRCSIASIDVLSKENRPSSVNASDGSRSGRPACCSVVIGAGPVCWAEGERLSTTELRTLGQPKAAESGSWSNRAEPDPGTSSLDRPEYRRRYRLARPAGRVAPGAELPDRRLRDSSAAERKRRGQPGCGSRRHDAGGRGPSGAVVPGLPPPRHGDTRRLDVPLNEGRWRTGCE